MSSLVLSRKALWWLSGPTVVSQDKFPVIRFFYRGPVSLQCSHCNTFKLAYSKDNSVLVSQYRAPVSFPCYSRVLSVWHYSSPPLIIIMFAWGSSYLFVAVRPRFPNPFNPGRVIWLLWFWRVTICWCAFRRPFGQVWTHPVYVCLSETPTGCLARWVHIPERALPWGGMRANTWVSFLW